MVRVKNWEELKALDLENEEYKVDVNLEYGYAYIQHKGRDFMKSFYMTTHTFYSLENAEFASQELQKRGFEVQLIK